MLPPGLDAGRAAGCVEQEHRVSMLVGGRLAIACLVWSLCVLLSEAYLFNLLLSNPVVKTELAERPADAMADHARPSLASRHGVADSANDLRSGDGAGRDRGGKAERAPSRGQPLRTRAVSRPETDLDPDLELNPESNRSGGRGEKDLDLDFNRPVGRRHSSAEVMRQHSVDTAEESTAESDIPSLLDSLLTPERVDEERCLSDRQCGRGRFCDSEEGGCRRRRRPGQTCSRDGECRGRSSTCTLGLCQRRQHNSQKKELVSECRSDADCDADSCCARLNTGTVCRPRTPAGQRCQALPANLPVPIYPTCPCERGTQCKYVHRPGEDWTLWKAYDNLRCVRDQA